MKPMQRSTQWILTLCLCLTTLGAQAFQMRGFRGVSWGEGVEALGEARAVYTDGEVTCYKRERENLVFGNTALTGVHYCFSQDHFFLVTLEAAVSANAFLAEFAVMYGPPDTRRGDMASWRGASPGARADLLPAGAAAARLTLYSGKAALAQRLQKLVLF